MNPVHVEAYRTPEAHWPAILACIAEGNQLSGATVPWLSEALFVAAGLLGLFYVASHLWERRHAQAAAASNAPLQVAVPIHEENSAFKSLGDSTIRPEMAGPAPEPTPLPKEEPETKSEIIEAPVAAPPASASAGRKRKKSRIFVGSGVTAGCLAKFHDGRTVIQARRALKPFIGKWMDVSGEVRNVTESMTGAWITVTLAVKGNEPLVRLRFEPRWRKRLEVLMLGEVIRVAGKIDECDSWCLELAECELRDI